MVTPEPKINHRLSYNPVLRACVTAYAITKSNSWGKKQSGTCLHKESI